MRPYVKQDNNFIIKSIMEHKTFIINHKWIMHKLYDVDVFCEIMFVLAGRKLINIFHTVGKKPAALLGGLWRDETSEGWCGISLRRFFRKLFKL